MGQRYGKQSQGTGRMPAFGNLLTDVHDQSHRRIRAGPYERRSCHHLGTATARHPHHDHRRHDVLWQLLLPPQHQPWGTARSPRGLAALAGWLFIMGAIWWTYGKGLLGPDASWDTVSGRTVLTSDTFGHAGALHDPIVVGPNADPTTTAAAVDDQFVKEGWKKLDPSVPSYQQAGAAGSTLVEVAGAFGAGEFQVVNVFDKGGQRSPQPFGKRFDFLRVLPQAALRGRRGRPIGQAPR